MPDLARELFSNQVIHSGPEELDMDGYYRFSINIRNTGSDKDTYILDASTGRPDWSASIETGGTQIDTLTVLKSGTEKVDIVLKPINYDDTFGVREEFQLSATSVSPGDGSAILSLDIIQIMSSKNQGSLNKIILIKTVVLFALLLPANTMALEIYSFVTNGCDFETGLVVNTNDEHVFILNTEGMLKKVERGEIELILVYNIHNNRQ